MHRSLLVALTTVAQVSAVAFTQQGLAVRSAGPFLTVPTQPGDLLGTLKQLAISHRQAMGIEVVSGPPTRERKAIEESGRYAIDLGGLAVPVAVEKVLERSVLGPVAHYEWFQAGRVLHVRPAAFRDNRAVLLNRTVSGFVMQAAGIRDALHRIHRLLDPTVRDQGQAPLPPRVPPALKTFFERPIAVSVSGATVRQILNEVALNHGSAFWIAEYQDGKGTSLKLSFVGFDKWSISLILGPPPAK